MSAVPITVHRLTKSTLRLMINSGLNCIAAHPYSKSSVMTNFQGKGQRVCVMKSPVTSLTK